MDDRSMFNKGIVICVLAYTLILVSCSTNSPDDLIPIPDNEDVITTYDNSIKSILDAACIECHGGATPTAGIRLDNYQSARDVADSGRMIFRMTNNNSPMPPSGQLPDPVITSVMKWIEDGLLEN